MRSLEYVRARARLLREEIGGAPEGLLDRMKEHIRQRHGKYLTPLASATMQQSRAEVKLGDPMLRYDRALDAEPEERILVIAHELGHLELHDRLSDWSVPPDPLVGSAYMGGGAPGVARYSEKAKEEAQANAFAVEFLCPADQVLAAWMGGTPPTEIAVRRGIPLRLVQAQLAEALFHLGADRDGEGASRPERPPTPAQRNAARDFGRPVLVKAGPGTGKTKTLVLRVQHLLAPAEERPEGVPDDIRPEQILVLTFSNEAAEELRARIGKRFDEKTADAIEICTFHTWGYVFLHHFRTDAGLDPDRELILLDEPAQAELVAEVLATADVDAILDLKDPESTAASAAEYVSFLKDRLWTPEDLERELDAWAPAEGDADTRPQVRGLLSVYRAYEEAKRRKNGVDFGDLILLPWQILSGNAELRAKVAAKHRFVMVDEYQDVSRAVAKLLLQICGDGNPPWVVGDKQQAIYRFRGAHPDNVDLFGVDFEGAFTHELDINFRSGPAVVAAANHLAALLEAPDFEGEPPARWRADQDLDPVAGPAVAIALANSDEAERQNIATQVKSWVDAGVPRSDIAVLARRNIDVRQISIGLNRLGVRAVTSGVVTAEGAAGDLAAVISLPDAPRAAVPRLAYALFGKKVPAAVLDAAIRQMVDGIGPEGGIEARPAPGAGGVVEEIARLQTEFQPLTFTQDGREVLCAFLFGHERYLRDLVARAEEPEAALAIQEIVTVLAAAAAHRYAHPRVQPRISRIGFGTRLRTMLSRATPALVPPPKRGDAVRVMTCHASKGLEFPYVLVAGQTLSGMERDDSWLPPRMRKDADDDARQADALLFVGVTRAERALVVSHASSASGTTLAHHQRERPLLLDRWAEQSTAPRLDWSAERGGKATFRAVGIWGGSFPELVSTYVVSGAGCAVRIYLQESLKAEFPVVAEPLWPAYVGVTRRAMQQIVREANETGRPLTRLDATRVLDLYWSDLAGREHPHPMLPLYRRYAENRVARLAAVYTPVPGAVDLPSTVEVTVEGGKRTVRTDVLGYFRSPGGRRRVIALETDSLEGDVKNGGINWTDLDQQLKVTFSLLHGGGDGDLDLSVYSDADGCIYEARWSIQKASVPKARTAAEERVRRGIAGEVEMNINPFQCGRCGHLVHCPHWIGAGEKAV
ncbi:MAG TPA: UvrD-helicase domain-containing protein [Longimicrobiaceae bacterium]|nr:UvrD-helicase domain-containing protein [Longimicrobiaceae bacterium]